MAVFIRTLIIAKVMNINRATIVSTIRPIEEPIPINITAPMSAPSTPAI